MDQSKETLSGANTSQYEEERIHMTLDDDPCDDAPPPIIVFGELIEMIVDPRDVMPYLKDILDEDAILRVRKICKNEGSQNGMRCLFGLLKDRKDLPSRWRTFVRAMEKSYYGYFVDLLSKEETLSKQAFFEMDTSFNEIVSLIDHLNPIDLFKLALQKDFISQEDARVIDRETERHGEIMGLVVLMEKIWRKRNEFTSFFGLIQKLPSTYPASNDDSMKVCDEKEIEKNKTSCLKETDVVTTGSYVKPLRKIQPIFSFPRQKRQSTSTSKGTSNSQWITKTGNHELHRHILTCEMRKPDRDRLFKKKKYECGNFGCQEDFLSNKGRNLHQDCYCGFRKVACRRKGQGCHFKGNPMETHRHEMEWCTYRRDEQVHFWNRKKNEDIKQSENQKEADNPPRPIDMTDGRTVSDTVGHNLQEMAADSTILYERERPTSEMENYDRRRDGVQIHRSTRVKFQMFWDSIPY